MNDEILRSILESFLQLATIVFFCFFSHTKMIIFPASPASPCRPSGWARARTEADACSRTAANPRRVPPLRRFSGPRIPSTTFLTTRRTAGISVFGDAIVAGRPQISSRGISPGCRRISRAKRCLGLACRPGRSLERDRREGSLMSRGRTSCTVVCAEDE